MKEWPAPVAAACLLIAGAGRLAQQGVTEGAALLAGGLVVLGWWLGAGGDDRE